ncbi:MAG: FecR family protein, partial [Candidatus Symbiothrix sp.]|nr:FecR family protein [Candidatus Symbiothrix sp.]
MEKQVKTDEDISCIDRWMGILQLHNESDVEARWQQLHKRIVALRFRQNIFRFVRNAAAVLLLPALIALFHVSRQSSALSPVAQIEINAAYGQISQVDLPDGSKVWLNSGSKLTYPQRFTDNTRQVALIGEAYFKVQADKQHRFEVALPDGLIAGAYGTEFNISTYPDDPKAEITLVSGRLAVNIPEIESPCIL